MPDSPGRDTTHRPMGAASAQGLRVLAALALTGVYVVGVALALDTMRVAWQIRDLLLLLIEQVLRLPNSAAHATYWLVLGLAGATAFLAASLALRSLARLVFGEEDVRAGSRLRVFAYLATGAVALNAFLFSSSVAINGPFRIQFPIVIQLLWTFVFGGYALWTIRVIRGRSRLPGRYGRIIGLVCINIVVALVAAELVLRVVARFVPIPILVTDESSSKIRRDAERLSPGTLRFGFPVNMGGHYDTEFLPPSERTRLTVASIGDSFSYGTVPHAYHYTTVIERENPEVEVYNMGFPGTGPRDYLYLLEGTALPLRPDLILIQIFASNDFGDVAPTVDPPRWYDADRYLLGILWHRWKILDSVQRKVSNDEVDPATQEGQSLEELYPFLLDPKLEVPAMGEELFSAIEVSRAKQIGTQNPVVQELFFKALEDLIAAARAHDVPLAFVMIPDEFQVEDELWKHILETSEVPLERDLVLRETVAWLKSRNVPVLDLLPILRAVEPLEDGDRHLYHLRETHFNARGNEVAGIAMAAFIEQVLAGVPDGPTEQSAGTETSLQNAASAGELAGDAATEVLRQFGARIQELAVNGSQVFDESLLDHPKDEIISAIVTILNGESPADQKAFASEAAAVLAFFQPGVGEAGVAIDSMSSGQRTWRDVVVAEMQANKQEIGARTQGR